MSKPTIMNDFRNLRQPIKIQKLFTINSILYIFIILKSISMFIIVLLTISSKLIQKICTEKVYAPINSKTYFFFINWV